MITNFYLLTVNDLCIIKNLVILVFTKRKIYLLKLNKY